ncbi:MAG: tyrosine-protein phosphatase, partial [Bacteroidales bacterium]|nr:tyrosine-protein phosphatase [Bacteroidales bacterium]
SGNNYYLKFNDGKYLVCDYGNSGNCTTGLRYVNAQSNVTYPYALTVNDGVFEFNTTQMTSTSSTNQVLYYKPASAGGTGPDRFKIGGSGVGVGVHLYLKGGGDTPAKQTQTLSFARSTITWTIGEGGDHVKGESYAFPQTVTGAKTSVSYTSETPAVVTISNNRITIVDAGSATIKATAAETDDYYGNSATYTLNIATPAPEGWVDLGTINLENTAVKDYLTYAEGAYTDTNEKDVTNVVYYATDSKYSSISRKDCPAPVTVTWTNPGSKSTVVTIYADQALTQQVWSQPATEGNSTTTSSDVYNLIPGLTYYYTVSENGSVWEKGQFNTTGRRRMIRVSGTQSTDRANNCRDLGGMITKDGTKRIKYGYIFRGSNMNRTTDTEKSILADFMKIRMDIDLRASGWGTQGASRAFPANDYPVIGYLNKGFNGYNDLASDAGLGRIGDIFNTIIDTVLEGKAVYFHCYVGADRTGIIGVILEGMLGISEKDCSIDYELTTFSRAVGNRPRDGSQNDHYFSQGLALLRGQSGSTFEQKCTNFLTSSKVGVSEAKINQFKNYILEGNN